MKRTILFPMTLILGITAICFCQRIGLAPATLTAAELKEKNEHAEWVKITAGADPSSYYVDGAAMTRLSASIFFRIKVEMPSGTAYYMALGQCYDKMIMRSDGLVMPTGSSEVVSLRDHDEDYVVAKPGTVNSAIVDYVCRNAKTFDVPASETDPIVRATPKPLPKTVSGGVLNGKAISKPQPDYPPAARALKASGRVTVQVVVDENGNVISAAAVSGHPLLQQAAIKAARAAKFSQTLLSGQPVKVSGLLTYDFVP